jgi:hypothetical protein
MTPRVAGYSQTLVKAMLENESTLTREQLAAVGKTARQLLSFAWDQPDRNSWLVTNSLRSVGQTFGTDPEASAALLRRAMEPEHLSRHGFEELRWIAREVQRFAKYDPAFAADLYVAVFSHEEASTDPTDMSGSRILSLTSNKKQDYDHAKWELAEYYPQFVEATPVTAAKAMLGVIKAYRRREDSTEATSKNFDFNGSRVGIVPDYSYIWDESFPSHDEEVKILNGFFAKMEELAIDESHAGDSGEILHVLTGGVQPAIIWRRLLKLGTVHPRSVGLLLRELAWAAPLVLTADTGPPAIDFIQAVFPVVTDDERRRIEEMIVGLPDLSPPELRKAAEHQRAQLLIRLNEAQLATEQAKALLRELQAANSVAEGAPAAAGPKFQVTNRAIDEEIHTSETLGASTDTEAAKEFLNLHRPVQEFVTKQTNKSLSREYIDTVLDSLRALHSALNNPPKGLDEKLLTMACGTLAGACKLVAYSDHLSCDTPAVQFALSVLLELSTHLSPEPDASQDASFDEHASWGSFIARIEAAAGIIAIARFESCCRDDVLDAIERLLEDPVPEVRFQVATSLTSLYKTAPDRMWALLESRSRQETSNAVLDALAHTVGRLAFVSVDRAAELTKTISENVREGPGADSARDRCLRIFVGLHVWRDQQTARQVVNKLSCDVLAHHHEAGVMLFALRDLLSHGDKDNEVEPNAVRMRAVRLFDTIVTSASTEVSRLLEGPPHAIATTDREVFQSILKLVDSAAHELYFASGVFTNKQAKEMVVPISRRRRFYAELADTIDRLSMLGYPSTVHHLIETLAQFISFNPRRVFLQIAALVENGKRWHYQFESMAANEITRIVERYIAEYRLLLQEDAECRVALRKVLDSFVEAGWPSAQRLSYRLDDIFR